MKFLTFSLALTMSAVSLNASASMSVTSRNIILAPFELSTLAPSATVVATVDCARGGDEACAYASFSATGLALSSSTIVLLKEDIQNVEPDALNFLAGEPMTLALEELVIQIRSEQAELADKNDSEIVSIMLESLEIK